MTGSISSGTLVILILRLKKKMLLVRIKTNKKYKRITKSLYLGASKLYFMC